MNTQPGTIAHRCLRYMRLQPTKIFTTGELAAALDLTSMQFINCTMTLRRIGSVRVTTRPGQGRTLYWSLAGEGAAPEPVEQDEPLAPAPPLPLGRGLSSVFDMGDKIRESLADTVDVLAAPAVRETPPPISPDTWIPAPTFRAEADAVRAFATFHAQPQASAMRIALWNDGQLVIERGDRQDVFTADETRELLRYVAQLAPVAP